MGRYTNQIENKTNLVHDQLWYALDDDESITVNKVFRCTILNSSGEYIKILDCQMEKSNNSTMSQVHQLIQTDGDIMAYVSSTYTDPSDTFVWWIEGDRLAIATIEGDANTSETGRGNLKAVQLGSTGD